MTKKTEPKKIEPKKIEPTKEDYKVLILLAQTASVPLNQSMKTMQIINKIIQFHEIK